MPTKDLGYWNEKKEKLRLSYPTITEEDLVYYYGKIIIDHWINPTGSLAIRSFCFSYDSAGPSYAHCGRGNSHYPGFDKYSA